MHDFKLPNIRKIFVPDKGYMLFDADLAGADAQVVAAEANDKPLLSAFQKDLDIHTDNARFMWPNLDTEPEHLRKLRRKQCKGAVHATNYGASTRSLCLNFKWSETDASRFQRHWFQSHPGVKEWHIRQGLELSGSRTATNRFGYRIIYFDRVDGLLPQALAWVPQSTVALVCVKGALQLTKACPWVEMLLQVHDSLVFQVPFAKADRIEEIRRNLLVPIPYPEPLVIPWGLARSERSWGDCEKIKEAA